jgi:parallel beta-helix repeat protein
MREIIILGVVFLFIGVGFQPAFAVENELTIDEVKDEDVLSLIHQGRDTIYVDDNNTEGPWDGTIDYPYQYIQDGIDNATDDDTIYVSYGKYYERVKVNKSLTIIGIESEDGKKPIVDAQQKGIVFKLNAQGSIIDGFVAQNAGKPFNDDICCFKVSAKDCIIRNNILKGRCYGGIRLMLKGSSDGTQVINNTIYGSDFVDGIIMPESSYAGSDYITISDNYIADVPYPMEIYAGNHNNIYRNYVTNGGRGIRVQYGRHNEIIENTVTKCDLFGIRVQDNYANCQILRNNVISNNGKGIHLTSNDWGGIHIVENNNIHHNREQGISLGNTDNCQIIDNNITYNKYGIDISESSTDNLIIHNDLLKNTINAEDSGTNAWDNGAYGNFYSDYKGWDLNPRDGIGDIPYRIPGGDNQDNYPIMKPWLNKNIKPIPGNTVSYNFHWFGLLERFPLLQQLLDVWRSFIE